MWIAYAFGSALFAGLTSILAKCGIKQTDSNVGSRSPAWNQMKADIWDVTLHTLSVKEAGTVGSVMLAGIATGASWSPSFFPLWSFMKRSPEKPSSACSSSWAGRC